jgi:predicted TIM-barrel fold metal-dependent hydrolase
VRTLTRKITKQFEKQIAQQVKTNPKKFWKYCMPDPRQKRKVAYLTYLKTIIKLSPLTQIRKKPTY